MSGKTILAIGAHIGDMELTAGGLLATAAVQGGRAVTLALTAGEKGAASGVDVSVYRQQASFLEANVSPMIPRAFQSAFREPSGTFGRF